MRLIMRICGAISAIAVVATVHAQTVKSPETVTTTDGRVLTLKPDGTYSIEKSLNSSVLPVKVERWLFEHHLEKYGEGSIRFMPVVRNTGPKTIAGFKFTAKFMDAFREDVFSFDGSSDERIKPKGLSTTKLFFSFDRYPTIHSKPYRKLLPLVLGGTANIEVSITSVAFSDGTILKAQ